MGLDISPQSGPSGDGDKRDPGGLSNLDGLILPRLALRPVPADAIVAAVARGHHLARISTPKDQRIMVGVRSSFDNFIVERSREFERSAAAGSRWVTAARYIPSSVPDYTGLSSPAHRLDPDGGPPQLPARGVVQLTDGRALFVLFCELRNRDGESIIYGPERTAFAYGRLTTGEEEPAIALTSAWVELSPVERANFPLRQNGLAQRYTTLLNATAFEQEMRYILSDKLLDPQRSQCAPSAWAFIKDGIAEVGTRHSLGLTQEELRQNLKIQTVELHSSSRTLAGEQGASRAKEISYRLAVQSNYGLFDVTIGWGGESTPSPFQKRLEVHRVK